MILEEYGNLIENAFKIQSWNYSRNDNEDNSIFGTTMNIYTDATKDFEKKGMEKFDEYINGVSTNYESLVVPVSRG